MGCTLSKYECFLQKTVTNLSQFLDPYIRDIKIHYNWSFITSGVPEVSSDNFNELSSWYCKTIKLKNLLVKRLSECKSFEERFVIGEYFVVKWGEVRTNKKLKELLCKYDQVTDLSNISELDGVSSWSKYLSLRTKGAAIYDSRVAYSINVINYLSGNTEYFFKMPNGRSPKRSLLDVDTLFLLKNLKENDRFISPEDLAHIQISSRVKNKYYLPDNITYKAYLKLLDMTSKQMKLDDTSHFKIEMLLFSLAQNMVFEALVNKCRVASKSDPLLG